jgi:exodeoxyribonuclease VII small subunit
MPQKNINYEAAITEIQQILAEIENDKADIDTLGVKIKRAAELITICRDKLTKTDAEVEKLLKEIE